MKILVTGGAGFIGSHLVDRLLREGHQLCVIDDLSGGMMENLEGKKLSLRIGDCRNEIFILDVFNQFKPEIVYHLAANAAENKAQFSPIDITSRNYDGFIKVLSAFIKNKGKRFIFSSSVAVYGSIQIPFYEIDKPEPEDLYGITKLAAEQTLKAMSDVHDFEYMIVRPHNVYGPRQNMRDPYRNVMTIWMNALLNKTPYYIYGDGEQKRCFSYIDDVVDAIYKCGFKTEANKTYNVGSDVSYSLNELSKNLQEVTNTHLSPIHLSDRAQEVKEAIPDHTLAHAGLDYKDSTSLKEGIAATWEWCKEQGPQKPIYTKIELPNKKMPENWLPK